MKSGTNTIFFIVPNKILANKKVTYIRLVASFRLLKTEVQWVRVIIRGDRLDFNGTTSIVPAILTMVKTHLNSIISDPNAQYLILDIKDYYYITLIDKYKDT